MGREGLGAGCGDGIRTPAAGDFSPTWEFSDAPAGIVRCRFPAVTSDRVRFWFEKDSSVRLYEVEVLEARDRRPQRERSSLRRDWIARRRWCGSRSADARARWRRAGWRSTAGNSLRAGTRHRLDGRRAAEPTATGAAGRRSRGGSSPAGVRPADCVSICPPGATWPRCSATDFVLPVRPFRVEGAGLQVGRPLATASRGAWEARRFRVEAGANGIELTFRGEAAWLVNALVIAPESNLNALLAEADRLEEELALGSPEWMEKRTMVPAPAPTEIARARGGSRARLRALRTRAGGSRLSLHAARGAADRPAAGDPGHAGRGGGRDAWGWCRCDPLFDMRLAGTDLAGPGGARIPASAAGPARGALLAADRQDAGRPGQGAGDPGVAGGAGAAPGRVRARGGDAPVLDHGARPGGRRARAVPRRAAVFGRGRAARHGARGAHRPPLPAADAAGEDVLHVLDPRRT